MSLKYEPSKTQGMDIMVIPVKKHKTVCPPSVSSSLFLSSLELSDTKVKEPEIRALLGTASHFC